LNTREIDDALDNVKIIDTHEHFSSSLDIVNEGADLFAILPRGYVGFFDFYPGLRGDLVQFQKYPEIVDKTYLDLINFVNEYHEHEFLDTLNTGMIQLHGGSIKALSEDMYHDLNASIHDRYQEQGYRDRVLHEFHVDHAVLDVPHHAGGLGHDLRDAFDPDFYMPAMRINSLLFGFDLDAWSPSTCLIKIMTNELQVLDGIPSTFEEYLDDVDAILDWSRDKVVSYKCASAYERTIDFGTKAAAEPGGKKFISAKNAFGKSFKKATERERIAFGDCVMHHVLGQIEGNGIPVQMHTGEAIKPGSNPNNVESLLAAYPGIEFTLLHCGYPWTSEVLDILKRHDNVHADMVWLQVVSQEAARGFLQRAIEENLAGRIFAFGGDCACIEGSIGALLRIKNVVRTVLGSLVDRGKIEPRDVESMVTDLFYNNPKSLFFNSN